MTGEPARARLSFSNAALAGIVTTVGDKRVLFAEEGPALGLQPAEISRLQRAIGLDARQVVSGEQTTVDLCENSARRLLAGLNVPAESVSGLIFVSQTPDHATPASAISLQHKLGLPVTCMAFDVGLGCSGFVYGLALAYSLVEAGLERVLLAVGDVASRFVDPTDHVVAPIMGDAGAVALIERRPSTSWFELYSDGSGQRALYIPNSGVRRVAEDEGKQSVMTMDGAAVFNFTLQRVPDLINDILAYSGKALEEVDYFVLHQPNKYILKNIQKRLSVPEEKFPSATQSVFGNQNSASIPGTISGFLSAPFSEMKLTSVVAGFGIGLSWGAAVIETDRIYAPPPLFGLEQE